MLERAAAGIGKAECIDDVTEYGILRRLVDVYNAAGMTEQAAHVTGRLWAMDKEVNPSDVDLTSLHLASNLGKFYCRMCQWAKAKLVLEETLRRLEEMSNVEAEAECYIHMNELETEKDKEWRRAEARTEIRERLVLKQLTLQHLHAVLKGQGQEPRAMPYCMSQGMTITGEKSKSM
ncbi:hypothetical protein K470DRAFT_254051 [Piedraia hortae CBS 480.64]|uniref:MalT-like TPR region domain-containing protein n=1 Tax=Piedraia hortae CBS 480.64 TaxID=1314780 RepID=A0A6A7CBI1_9PEZI|nr:hypothetical protein K470DRAFT_254051 [Piedraia hortae CBS 480.64]